MPKNKRESLIFTVMMCFTMVLWMSIYNVSLQMHSLSLNSVAAAWMGFPVAYIFAMCCDWFFVSMLAKTFAFRFLVNEKKFTIKNSHCNFILHGYRYGYFNVILWSCRRMFPYWKLAEYWYDVVS